MSADEVKGEPVEESLPHSFPMVGAGATPTFLDTEQLLDRQIKTEEAEDNEDDMPPIDEYSKTQAYNEVINAINKGIVDEEDRWEFEEIIGHRVNPKNDKLIDLKIKWTGYMEPTWEPLRIIWEDDPKSVRAYT